MPCRKAMNITMENHLDLPVKIKAGHDSLAYIYDAMGTKLAKKLNGSVVRYYVNGIEYNDNEIDRVHHDEGYIDMASGGAAYKYFLRENLILSLRIFP
jgi:hypothetical protein